MQTVPGWPTDTTGTTPAAVVTVGGVAREVSSLSVSREIATAPGEGSSGITAATGSVSFTEGPLSGSRSAHPWALSSWPPRGGESVTVDCGYGSALARVLTGRVDGADGRFSDGSVRASLVDGIDVLSRPVSFAPTLSAYHASVRPGLTSVHLIDRVLRACGLYTSRPTLSGSALHVPNMGSAEPAHGELRGGTAQSNPNASVVFVETSWGQAAADAAVSYSLLGSTQIVSGSPLRMSVQVSAATKTGAAASATAEITAVWSVGNERVVFTIEPVTSTTRRARAKVWGAGDVVMGEVTLTIPMTETYVDLGFAQGALTLWLNASTSATANVTVPAAMTATGADWVDVTIPAGAYALGDIQVGRWANPYTSAPFTPTARITGASAAVNLSAHPTVVRRDARELLREHADAVGAAMWFDEHGVFRWTYDFGGTVATLTSEDNLLEVEWETPSARASRVDVTWRQAAVRALGAKDVAGITVWRGSVDSYDSGEIREEFIGPDADHDWVGVDTNMQNISSAAGDWNLRHARGSFAGGVLVYDDDTTPDSLAFTTHSTTALTQVELNRWKLRTEVHTLPAGTSFKSADLSGRAMPSVLASGYVSWVDRSVTGATTGPADAAVLVHDAGPYVQLDADAQAIADNLSTWLTVNRPVVRNLRVVPDLRLQLGDGVIVEDRARSGVRLTATVIGIDVSASANDGQVRVEQSLTLRVNDAQIAYPTLDEVDALWAPNTVDQMETASAGRSLADFDQDPTVGHDLNI